MAKKIIIGVVFSLLLTWLFWRLTGLMSLGREIDDIVFLGSPLLAIVISVLLVRSKLMTSNNASQNTDV
jgi:high-affinity Fe2+/Pb2+ permease